MPLNRKVLGLTSRLAVEKRFRLRGNDGPEGFVQMFPKKRPGSGTGMKKAAARGGRKPAAARPSGILASIHETVAHLHQAGIIKTETMREFDELCLAPVDKLDGRAIANLRRREKVSQPVFARYLNVSKSSVAQWEAGAKNPDGAALKLLNLVKRKGLEALT